MLILVSLVLIVKTNKAKEIEDDEGEPVESNQFFQADAEKI